MTLIRLLVATLALTTFAGCKNVDIKDGQIPSNYLSQAKALAGTYKGHFEGTPGNLIVSFNGNKPVIKYVNKRGNDILNNNCQSEFGDLLKVTIKNENKNPTVSSTLFDFDAGGCSLMVSGRDATISFKETDKGTRLTISILKEVQQQQICEWRPGNGHPNRPSPPSQYCYIQQTAIHMYGTFYR